MKLTVEGNKATLYADKNLGPEDVLDLIPSAISALRQKHPEYSWESCRSGGVPEIFGYGDEKPWLVFFEGSRHE